MFVFDFALLIALSLGWKA